MREITYTEYSDEDLPSIVRFWNASFSTWPNAVRMTAHLYRTRVVELNTGVEAFEPKGFILAWDGKKIVGYCHSGTRSGVVCRRLYDGWEGGSEGFIALIYVAKDYRNRGIGTELMRRAKQYLYGTARIVIDGQVFNPFYGNSAGPATCFFGTTEGISVPDEDEAAKKFFSREGFEKRYTGVALEVALSSVSLKRVGATRNAAEDNGVMFRTKKNVSPTIGMPERISLQYDASQTFDSFYAVRDGLTIGIVVSYPMKGLVSKEKKAAIYHLEVSKDARGIGLGEALLSSALVDLKSRRQMKKCETLTLQEVSPEALKLYKKVGFKEMRRWAIY
ncbi:MAG: GNAT family N-acetyltransferase [Planctomycetota bacterium]|nr:MAG: GNAT family N-acetyltransferase [Planctomycetota bacterium]